MDPKTQFYLSQVILTELMMISMILHVINYSGFTKQQKTWFILTYSSIMLCSAAEFAVHSGYYVPSLKIPLTIITVIQFSVAPLLGVFFSGALGLHKGAKYASIFFSLNLIVEIVASFNGWIFVIGDSGYERGEYFIIYEVFYIISLAYLIVSMFIVGKRFRHRDFFTIFMILVVLVAGIIPMTFFKINITYLAIALAASLCYIYYNDLTQQDIQSAYKENQKKISSMQTHIISGLANLIENRDIETGEHIVRTSYYSKTLAEHTMKDGVYSDQIDERFIQLMFDLSPLHDIGKIVVSDRILRKPAKLDEKEYEQMKKHAAVGGRLVGEVLNGITDEEYLSFASDIATYHHERWDGSGYPKGLKGEEIPLSARIMAISDAYDALISKRCYKEPIPVEESLQLIKEESGKHFDPLLVEVLLNHKEDFILPNDSNNQ